MRHHPVHDRPRLRVDDIDLDFMSTDEAIRFVASLIEKLAFSRKHGFGAGAAAISRAADSLGSWFERHYRREPFIGDAYLEIAEVAERAEERIG